jgi:hypothetical protein
MTSSNGITGTQYFSYNVLVPNALVHILKFNCLSYASETKKLTRYTLIFIEAYQTGDGDPVLTEQLPTLADSKSGPTRADHSPSGCDGKEMCATPQVKAWESVCGKY